MTRLGPIRWVLYTLKLETELMEYLFSLFCYHIDRNVTILLTIQLQTLWIFLQTLYLTPYIYKQCMYLNKFLYTLISHRKSPNCTPVQWPRRFHSTSYLYLPYLFIDTPESFVHVMVDLFVSGFLQHNQEHRLTPTSIVLGMWRVYLCGSFRRNT